jgi:adenylosuccinate synthase
MIDILASGANLCLRAQGGHNAGHTIVANGVTYDFHLIPSGIIHSKCINLIGSGCVIHVPSFFKELDALKSKGIDFKDRLFISDRGIYFF